MQRHGLRSNVIFGAHVWTRQRKHQRNFKRCNVTSLTVSGRGGDWEEVAATAIFRPMPLQRLALFWSVFVPYISLF